MGLKPREMVTVDNVREYFPAPRAENPFAGEPWWAIQGVGLMTALQILRIVPAGGNQQRALSKLRECLNECLMAVSKPDQVTIDRRMAQTMAPFVPSLMPVVSAMLDLAEVGPGDRLVDLGCGDGRIVFEAAKRGAQATGIDIDPEFISMARRRMLTEEPELARRLSFECGDLLDISLSDVSVVTCYLVSSSMALLRERFQGLRPGTKVVSSAFQIEGWEPTKVAHVDGVPIFLWIV